MEGKKHPPALLFLQDFCKNAQWRAKKLRERGSSTARPTEKGVGGSPNWRASCRFRRDFVAICGLPLGVSCRFGRFRRVVSCRFGRVVSCRLMPIWSAACVAISVDFGASCRADSVESAQRGRCRSQDANTKKSPIPQSENRDQLSQGVALGELPFVVVSSQGVVSVVSKSRRKHKKSPIPQSGDRAQLSQGVARS